MNELTIIPWRDKAQLAFGLTWTALPGIERRSPIDEARDAIAELDEPSPWAAIVTTAKRNYFSCWPADQKLGKAGTYSALALAAKNLAEESLIYLPLPNGRVWIGIAGGQGELRHQHPDRVLDAEVAVTDVDQLLTDSNSRGRQPPKLRVLEGHVIDSNFSNKAKPITMAELFGTPAASPEAKVTRLIASPWRYVRGAVAAVVVLGGIWLYKQETFKVADAAEAQDKLPVAQQYQPTQADFDLR
jgi:hypothetical protein